MKIMEYTGKESELRAKMKEQIAQHTYPKSRKNTKRVHSKENANFAKSAQSKLCEISEIEVIYLESSQRE